MGVIDVTADRGRDVSHELTEVRTVLSRAESARGRIAWFVENETTHEWERGGTWDYDRDPAAYVGGTFAADTDARDMLAALDDVIERLARWRRTGRGRKS